MCTIVGTEMVPHFKFLWREGMSSQMSKIGQKARLHRMNPTFFTTKPLVGRKSRLFRSCVVVGGLKINCPGENQYTKRVSFFLTAIPSGVQPGGVVQNFKIMVNPHRQRWRYFWICSSVKIRKLTCPSHHAFRVSGCQKSTKI